MPHASHCTPRPAQWWPLPNGRSSASEVCRHGKMHSFEAMYRERIAEEKNTQLSRHRAGPAVVT